MCGFSYAYNYVSGGSGGGGGFVSSVDVHVLDGPWMSTVTWASMDTLTEGGLSTSTSPIYYNNCHTRPMLTDNHIFFYYLNFLNLNISIHFLHMSYQD